MEQNKARNIGLLVTAFILPMPVQWLGTASAYWVGTLSANWVWHYVATLTGLALGTYCFARIPIRSEWLRALAVALYVPTILVVMIAVSVFTACFHGDCY
jgi:hypothetical protein